MDSTGLEIFALSSESGRLHWLATGSSQELPGNGQGFGTISANGTILTINYRYVPPLFSRFAEGSLHFLCSATGDIQERQSLIVTTNCTTTIDQPGTPFSTTASLTYDPLYERDSSLSVIAGNYDISRSIANINANGEIFVQDAGRGCVINGQVNIIDSQFNAYDVSVTYSNCVQDDAVLNGATFTGLAILDNTLPREQVIATLTGTTQENFTISMVLILTRM